MTSKREKMIYQMYIKENMTAEQIAEETGLSLQTIRNDIRKYGLYKKDRLKVKDII